jgi:hypothetical protein
VDVQLLVPSLHFDIEGTATKCISGAGDKNIKSAKFVIRYRNGFTNYVYVARIATNGVASDFGSDGLHILFEVKEDDMGSLGSQSACRCGANS